MINLPSLRLNLSLLSAAVLLVLSVSASAEVFELRTYTTNEGKLDDLHSRFRDHTIALFEKHGMESVGYWVPTDGEEAKNTLIYVLRHESAEAAKASWQAFIGDPEWRKVYAASIADGRLLAKAPGSVFMTATDYTPEFAKSEPDENVVFELRTYKVNEGKLGDLDRRFSDHTIDLFAKHGMESVAYWHPTQEPDSKDTLIYLLRHTSREGSGEAWKAFVTDPEWQKVFAASRANGALLRAMPDAVFMTATDYSAIR